MKITQDQIPERPKLVAQRVEIIQKSYDITLRLKNHLVIFLPFIIFLILSIPVGNFVISKQTERYILIPIIYGAGIVLFFVLYKLEQLTLPNIGFSTFTSSPQIQIKLIYVVYPSELDKTRIVFGLKTFVDQYDQGQVLLGYLSSDYSEISALGMWLAETIRGITDRAVKFDPTDLQKSEFPVRFALRYSPKHQKSLNLPQLNLTHPRMSNKRRRGNPIKKSTKLNLRSFLAYYIG